MICSGLQYSFSYGKNDYQGRIPNCIDIDERPSIVDARTRIGDWEVDLVIGKKRPMICSGLQYSFSFSLM
jgi:IS30 family transposase